MRLAGIRAGDIVRVHDGLPWFAEVIGRDGARVRVAPPRVSVHVCPAVAQKH